MGKYDNTSRRISIGTIVFYVLYFLMIGAFVIGMFAGIDALKEWLTDFELSQSTIKSQEVYEELFANPDWIELYEMSGQKDTIYEGAEAYATYMEKQVAGKKLVMGKTSAGLDSTKEKYLILLDKKPIASFTLKNTAGASEPMPHWELDTMEISFKRQESVQILTAPGHTVFINGVPLDDSHITSRTFTLAEEYLPEGVHGYRQQMLQLDGLLVAPTVTIQDENGEMIPVHIDAETGLYYETFSFTQLPEDIKDRAIAAAKLYARYTQISDQVMSKTALLEYFSESCNAYQTLPPSKYDLFLQGNKGYSFSEAVISEFYQYSDSLCSLRISLTITVTRKDGSTKDYPMDTTYVFQQLDGKWMIVNTTNKSLQESTTQVKLTYMVGDKEIHSEFVDNDTVTLKLPASPEAPEGKEFLGWFYKEINEKGQTVMHLAFEPNANNEATLKEGTVLQALVLYAQFGEAKA